MPGLASRGGYDSRSGCGRGLAARTLGTADRDRSICSLAFGGSSVEQDDVPVAFGDMTDSEPADSQSLEFR